MNANAIEDALKIARAAGIPIVDTLENHPPEPFIWRCPQYYVTTDPILIYNDFDKATWNPRHDANQACILIDRMKYRGYSFGYWDTSPLSSYPHNMVAFKWGVTPPTLYGDESVVRGHGDTFADAVCDAVLQISKLEATIENQEATT